MTTDHRTRTIPDSITRARRIALGLIVLAVLIVAGAVIFYLWWTTTRVPTVV